MASGDNSWHSRLLSENDYTYDDVGQRLSNRVTAAAVNADGSPQYTGGTPQYDNSGSVTNQVTNTRTEQYAYDSLNRLTTVDYGDGQTQGYAFDAMGNRLSESDSAAGAASYTFDAANQLTAATGAGAATYTSDADGNTLSDGTRTSVWDSQNRLVSCTANGTTSTSTHGADGLRRSFTVGGVTTFYAYHGLDSVVGEGTTS